MIENKLQYYQTYEGYKTQKDAHNIPNDSLVFIEDTLQIVTHGEEGFGGAVRTEDYSSVEPVDVNLNDAVLTVEQKLSETQKSTARANILDKETDQYAYSKLGRVVLPKHVVNGHNTLTQDMFYKDSTASTSYDITIDSSNAAVINDTSYYYEEVSLTTGQKLTLVDTTHCVLLNSDHSALIDGTTITADSALIVCVASTATGTYSTAYIISVTTRVPRTNTIYVIEYDYELAEDITIPEGCVLQFDGGSISNGTIRANNGRIIAPNMKIFHNVNIPADNFLVEEAWVDWFYSNDLGDAFTRCMKLLPNNCGSIKASSRKYNLTTPCIVKGRINVDFNSCDIDVNASVPVITDLNYDTETNYGTYYTKISNVNIKVHTKPHADYYTIDIANSANCEYKNIVINTDYDNVESTDKVGIAIGRVANGYVGTKSCNTIDNCFCSQVYIYSTANEGTISNCKLWASNYIASITFNTNSNWIVDNNQLVGGAKGAIYIPNNQTLSNVRITNNYFDGSYYNIDTHNGIYTEQENPSGEKASVQRCIIANNLFWNQKERGIYVESRSSIISGNVFDDCDNWNYGLEDININCLYTSNIISNNIFSRLKYYDPNSENPSVERPRITEDSATFTRPACIVITGGWEGAATVVNNNRVRNSDAYNKTNFGSDRRLYSSSNNDFIIPDFGKARPTDQLPSEAEMGEIYYDTTRFRLVIKGGRWNDGRGYPIGLIKGTSVNRPKASSVQDGILETYDEGYQYYDTDLHKPIFWDGTVYRDSKGFTATATKGTTTNRPKGEGVTGGVLKSSRDVGFEYFDGNVMKPLFVKSVANDGTVTWIEADGIIADTPRSGTFANKPTVSANSIPVGFAYFCTDKQTTEGATDGIMIYHKGSDVWVDALGRTIS